MKTKNHIYTLVGLAILYIIAALVMIFKFELPVGVIQHLIFTAIGMALLIFLSYKNSSWFLELFTKGVFVYNYLTSMPGILLSIIKDDLNSMERANFGALADTEAFIIFIALMFLFIKPSKKRPSIF